MPKLFALLGLFTLAAVCCLLDPHALATLQWLAHDHPGVFVSAVAITPLSISPNRMTLLATVDGKAGTPYDSTSVSNSTLKSYMSAALTALQLAASPLYKLLITLFASDQDCLNQTLGGMTGRVTVLAVVPAGGQYVALPGAVLGQPVAVLIDLTNVGALPAGLYESTISQTGYIRQLTNAAGSGPGSAGDLIDVTVGGVVDGLEIQCSPNATAPAYGAGVSGVVTAGMGAGSLVLAVAVKGQPVQGVTDLTTPANAAVDFEPVISVAGHIQQLGNAVVTSGDKVQVTLGTQLEDAASLNCNGGSNVAPQLAITTPPAAHSFFIDITMRWSGRD